MIPSHSISAYCPARATPSPPVFKKQVRFVSDDELSSDTESSSDSDSLYSFDSDTSVTSTGSWAEPNVTSATKIAPTHSIMDFRNPAFGKFFDAIDVNSPEALQIASLDLARFEANLQLLIRASNTAFPSAALLRPHCHIIPRSPSRSEALALEYAAFELRDDIPALEVMLAQMHKAGANVKEIADGLRATKRVLDCLDNGDLDRLESGTRIVAAPRLIRPTKKSAIVNTKPTMTPIESASRPRVSSPVSQVPATRTTSPCSTSPLTSGPTREQSPPRAIRRKPVPEAFPLEQVTPVGAAVNRTPPRTLSVAIVPTNTPPPASSTLPKKRSNHLPASPAPMHRPALASPTHPTIAIVGPTPINQVVALPGTYQTIPTYPSRPIATESAPSPRVVKYKRVSWPESGSYVVPVAQGHITASHVARC